MGLFSYYYFMFSYSLSEILQIIFHEDVLQGGISRSLHCRFEAEYAVHVVFCLTTLHLSTLLSTKSAQCSQLHPLQ